MALLRTYVGPACNTANRPYERYVQNSMAAVTSAPAARTGERDTPSALAIVIGASLVFFAFPRRRGSGNCCATTSQPAGNGAGALLAALGRRARSAAVSSATSQIGA